MRLRPDLYAEVALSSAMSYIKYINDGTQPANIWIKAAVQRGVDNRASGKWKLKWTILEDVFKFCSRLNIPDSNGKMGQFRLSPYQCWMLLEIFLYYNEDGSRRITEVVYFTGRKSGKTMFAAIIAFFMVLEQGYADPESYFAASGAKQAGILLRYCKSVAKNSLNVRIRSERQVYQIKYYNDGKSEAVANKTGGELDGLKPLIAVLDECHALPDNALRSAFTRGMGWSMDTLFMSISTAGINVMNYFYKQVTHGKLILSTNTAHVDDKTQYFLFTLDDGDLERDDLSTNEDLWYKANPNLGVTPPLQGFRDDIEKAWLMDEDRAEFCVKNFNVFNTGMDAEKLFSTTDYNRNIEEFNIEDFYGCELYLGFDLAPKIDLTAIGAVVKKDGIYYAWSDLYVAGTKDALVRKGTKVNFADHKEWININWHGVTPDYQAIRDRFQFYKDNFQIQGVGFDPAFSGTLMQDVELMGIDVIPVKQYHVAYNEVVIMMENALAEDKLKFDGNIIQRYCFYNAMKDENKHGMRMVGKRESKLMGDAVDATVAIMTAFNIYIGQNIEHSAIAEYYNRIING